MNEKTKTIDIICVGELVIDMMSADYAETMDEAVLFKKLPGGSPANLAMNMKRLGKNVRLVSTIGKDDFGNYLLDYLQHLDLNTEFIFRSALPTTLILVTKSLTVSNFEAYRSADCQINLSQLKDGLLKQAAILHTTCFALSKKPAQTNIVKAAERAIGFGCQLSIDVNYAQKIWEDRVEAHRIIHKYIGYGAFVKCSEVDWERLYGAKLTDATAAAQHFLDLGAKEVCMTMGSEGCFVANRKGEKHFLETRKIEVKDTTGAGDAFWSGYLTARLDGNNLLNAAKAGRKMAELKITNDGPLPPKVDKTEVYGDFLTT